MTDCRYCHSQLSEKYYNNGYYDHPECKLENKRREENGLCPTCGDKPEEKFLKFCLKCKSDSPFQNYPGGST